MNYKVLLEKYWVGETSIEEEKALKKYFAGTEIAEELLPYAAVFQYCEVAKKTTLAPSVDTLLARKQKRPVQRFLLAKKYWLRSTAATILVLIVASIGFKNLQPPSKAERVAAYWASKETKDPKEAFLKAKAALLLASKQLNNGTDAALKQVAKVQQVGQFIKSPE